jgi:hypothetical protein
MNTKGRVMGGVCIILSPTFDLAHKKSGEETITIPASEGENFEGRFIGIPLTFPNTDDNGKKTSKGRWTSHFAQSVTQSTTKNARYHLMQVD